MSLPDQERFDAIFHVRDLPYLKNQDEIDDFIDVFEKKCNDLGKPCCEVDIFKTRTLFIKKNYPQFIPKAIEILRGDCEIAFRDSVLLVWSLAKAIEKGGVYQESIKYRRVIDELLPRYLAQYPDHLQYLTNMSDFYFSQGKYPEAVAEYKKNLKHVQEQKQTFYWGTFSNSIGVCYNKINKPDSALVYFKDALKYYVSYNNYDSAYINGLINGNIAQSYMLKGQFNEAIPLLIQDIDGSRNLEPNNSFNSMIELANCYLAVGENDLAKNYIDSLHFFVKDIDLGYQVHLKYLELKAKVYQSNQMLDSSNVILKKIISIIKKKDREVAINQSNVLDALYGVNEKQKIIDKQKIENQNVQIELVQKSRNQFLAIGISVAILIVLIVVLITHNKVSKQRRQLHEKNEINKASLEEKEVLLKEIHHRVKNNLQVVSGLLHLQSSKIDSPELLAIIEEGQQRIESMALIHQMLYQDDNDVSVINCEEYLDELIGQIEHSYGGEKNISITINSKNVQLGFDYAIPLGLIVNELTVNSFKYAFPSRTGTINIELFICENQQFKMIFSDNGIGLPNVENIASLNSLGLRLVRMFCEEMDAELRVSNTPGATFEISFKECKRNEREG
ncbi:MAG: tetratricopeptide repeat-containing sensor histidine kinase [Salibacteraceae bacterium]